MGIKRKLRLFDFFCLVAGSMISSGIFILPGLVYLKIGPLISIAYLIAGLLVIPTLFSKMELSSAMPNSGGEYFFFDRSLGAGLGTLTGMAAWFSLAIKSAFALLGIGVFMTVLFPSISYSQVKLITIFFCLFFMVINMIITKHSLKLHSWLVIVIITILALFLFFGSGNIKLDNFSNFNHSSTRDLFATVGLIFIAYCGLNRIVSKAGKKRIHNNNLTLTTIFVFLIVTILYTLVVYVTVGVLGDHLLKANSSATLTPISDAAQVFGGQIGKLLLAIAALLAFISIGNAGFSAASRIPFAMSRAKLLPVFFSRVNKDYHTPHHAIVVTVILMIAAISVLDLELLVKTASTICLILFSLTNLSLIIMRESHIQSYQPEFKAPLYPWLQVIAILIYCFLIFEMGKISLMISGIFLLLCLIWYQLYSKIHSNRENSLINLIRKIKSSELDSFELEAELREIIMERDSIQQERFNQLIERCPVIDIQDRETKEEFFARVAYELNNTLDCGEREIFYKLMTRESERSTLITHNLAIPHIILTGEYRFEILLVRSRQGVYFSERFPNVKIIFIVTGSKDERNFHLRALAKIIQIVQQPDFQEKWLNAQNVDALRDIILLANRPRH